MRRACLAVLAVLLCQAVSPAQNEPTFSAHCEERTSQNYSFCLGPAAHLEAQHEQRLEGHHHLQAGQVRHAGVKALAAGCLLFRIALQT